MTLVCALPLRRLSRFNSGFFVWSGSKPRCAHFEAARQFLLRKFGRQEVKSTSSTREARLLTPKFARKQLRQRFGGQNGHQSASRQKSIQNNVIPAEAAAESMDLSGFAAGGPGSATPSGMTPF